MIEQGFAHLEDVVQHELFPGLDLALRRGRHIDLDDAEHYSLLVDAQAHLEGLYRRYGCDLVRADGYFYLRPLRDDLGRRHLSVGDMLVGQALALLQLDPATLKSSGVVSRTQVVTLLAGLVGEEKLLQTLNPRRKRRDERVEQEAVRKELDRALRTLAALGFIDFVEEDSVRLRTAVMRFAEPVRGLADPAQGLARLVARGDAVEGTGSAEDEDA